MSNVTSRLQSISDTLARIGQNARNLLTQNAPSVPESAPTRYTGSTRRLSDDEERAIVKMLDEGYSVQFIASEFAVSRPTVYNTRDKHRPQMHHRQTA